MNEIINNFLLTGTNFIFEMHVNLKIYLKDPLLIKSSLIKHLIFLKIRNIMDIKQVLLQWFINLLI